jgi:DNA-binding transcriptional LysR family regulator
VTSSRSGYGAATGDLKALASHQLVVYLGGTHGRSWKLQRGEESFRLDSPARLRVNNVISERDALVSGLGIGQMPLPVAAQPLRAGQLVRVLPGWAREPATVHAIYPSNRYLTPMVRAFVDLAVESFAGDGAVRSAPPQSTLSARTARTLRP